MPRDARDAAGPAGLVVVDKPAGMTSHDVVARVRRIAHTRRVGHGGTLDPMATGVLVVGIGRATRLLTYVIGAEKRYSATIRLGATTVTDDAEGDVVATASPGALAGVADEAIRAGLAAQTGTISQVPTAVSAIKVDGRRAYAMVRAGDAPELKAREVTVFRLDVHEIRRSGAAPDRPSAPAAIDIDVDLVCSSGTYVRAIARDLGAVLGVGGHLTALRRAAVGGFTLAEASTLDDLAARVEAGGDPVSLGLADAAARFFLRRDVSPDEARVLSHGGPLVAAGIERPYAVFGPDGEVIAIVAERDGRARAEVVLAPAG